MIDHHRLPYEATLPMHNERNPYEAPRELATGRPDTNAAVESTMPALGARTAIAVLCVFFALLAVMSFIVFVITYSNWTAFVGIQW